MRTRLLAAVLAPLLLMVTAGVALDPADPAPVEEATARASSEPVTYRAAPPASTPLPSMADAPTTTTTVAPAPPAPRRTPRPAPAPVARVAAPAPAAAPPANSGGVLEAIRSAFAPHGQAAVDTAMRVADCESGYNPRAQNPSGASGTFQIMPGWADEYLSVTGQPYYDGRFDPWANARFAAWLAYEAAGGGWSHWSCWR